MFFSEVISTGEHVGIVAVIFDVDPVDVAFDIEGVVNQLFLDAMHPETISS